MGNKLICGEALLKDPERPLHSEWYGGSIMSLSATLGLIRSPITLHKATEMYSSSVIKHLLASGEGREVARKGKYLHMNCSVGHV